MSQDNKIYFIEIDYLLRDVLPKDLTKIIYNYYNNFCSVCNTEMKLCINCEDFFCIEGDCSRCYCLCLLNRCMEGVYISPYDENEDLLFLYPINECVNFLNHSHISNCFYKTCFKNSNYLFCYSCFRKKII